MIKKSKRILQVYMIIFMLLQAGVFLCAGEANGPKTFLDKLYALPGIEVTEIPAAPPHQNYFQVTITQPLDHFSPNGETFTQRFFLSHIDETKPMVFVPTGYGSSRNFIMPITRTLGANQIIMPTRFYGGAIPAVMDWQYLTLRQSSADYHRIIKLFRKIYKGKWLSAGRSKGGTECLLHRRLYPNDVDATLAYVAPVALGTEDPRIDTFLLEQVGDEACRQEVMAFQRRALQNKEALIPLIQDYAAAYGLSFPMTEEAVLEYVVLEYIFSFWQYGPGDCGILPAEDATAQEIFGHLENYVSFSICADFVIAWFEPSYYQSYTEMGYYRFITEHLAGLLSAVSNPTSATFAPQGVELEYNPEVMRDLKEWTEKKGNNIIYLYGEYDPWTACAVNPSDKTNAVKIVHPGANHMVSLFHLTFEEKELVYTSLEEWLDVTIER